MLDRLYLPLLALATVAVIAKELRHGRCSGV